MVVHRVAIIHFVEHMTLTSSQLTMVINIALFTVYMVTLVTSEIFVTRYMYVYVGHPLFSVSELSTVGTIVRLEKMKAVNYVHA